VPSLTSLSTAKVRDQYVFQALVSLSSIIKIRSHCHQTKTPLLCSNNPRSNHSPLFHIRSTLCTLTRGASCASAGRDPCGSCIGTYVCVTEQAPCCVVVVLKIFWHALGDSVIWSLNIGRFNFLWWNWGRPAIEMRAIHGPLLLINCLKTAPWCRNM